MKNMISATIVADSINKQGNRITTMKVVFPRIVLAEFNTHRLFSRNSASSRAIPAKKMLKMVEENPFIPIAWQKEHSGMQGNEYLEGRDAELANGRWLSSLRHNIEQVKLLTENIKATKQLSNRLLESFMYHTVLITATEFDNFFNLRCPQYVHEGIDKTFKSWRELYLYLIEFGGNKIPLKEIENATTLYKLQNNKGQGEIHIMDLAEKMYDALNESTPKLLQPGEWHIPFGDNFDEKELSKLVQNHISLNPSDSYKSMELYNELECKIATARCARLSYQTLGDNPTIDYNKDLQLYETLKNSGHFSPFEHVARAMNDEEYISNFKGNPRDLDDAGWNANFKGFIQMRSLLES